MNLLTRRILLFVAVCSALYATLFAANLHSIGTPVGQSRIVWAGFAGALFLAGAAWKLPLSWRIRIVLLIFCGLFVETAFQLAGWLGVLPAVNTKVHTPYGRVYWTAEGFSNSVRNRYGWNFPAFDLSSHRRIAVIGDSFVEAVEVDRTKNHGALLRQLVHEQDPDSTVLAFGNHGTPPAQHIETLRYVQKHFPPQEVILFIYLGNDITESSPELNYTPPELSVYYTLDGENRLVVDPRSAPYRDNLGKAFDNIHRPVLLQLPTILYSHCMTLQTLLSIRDTLGKRKTINALRERGFDPAGLNLSPFEIEPSETVKRAMATMFAEIGFIKDLCDQGKIQLRIVDIPFFPQEFYESQHGREWTAKIGAHDYLLPDRTVAEFAHSRSIPFLSLADYLVTQKMSIEDIRSLYLTKGSGHFSEAGHRLCAEAVFRAFYAGKAN